jgi:hypothetical protein
VPDETDELSRELRALGRQLDVAPAPDPARMAAAVRQRLEQPRSRPWLRYAAAAVLVAFAALVAGSAQVRAAIVELFRFGGVVVEQGAPSAPNPNPGSSIPATALDGVAAARAAVPFPILVPAELGTPDEVAVTDGRVVSFAYRATGIRIDQFGGTLDAAFAKQVPSVAGVEWTQVDGAAALWVPGPHEVVYLDRDGRRHVESARLAADTLVWQRDGVTFRLEGSLRLERAIAIAQSMR